MNTRNYLLYLYQEKHNKWVMFFHTSNGGGTGWTSSTYC